MISVRPDKKTNLNKPLLCIAACLLLTLTGCVQNKTYIGSDKPVVEKELDPIAAAKTRISLGLVYLQKGSSAQAKYNLEKALEFAPELPEANYSLAYYYQTVNNKEKAQYFYEKVISLDEENGDAYNNYGAFLCDQGDVKKARNLFLKAVEIDSYIRVAQTYENLGLCLYDSGEPEYQQQAKDYFIKALGYNARLVKSLSYLTQISLDEGDIPVAWAYFEQLEKVIPRQNASFLWLSYQLNSATGYRAKAEQVAERLLTLFPKSGQAKLYKELNR